MTGEIEAAGDIVAGGLIAHAVEPRTGDLTHESGKNCLNCGTALVGTYCHGCGQKGHIHRTLTAFWHDLAHGVLHFEGKIWRTLPLLFWRPGELTRRYVHGERARFVSPLALFLFSVFLMFAVLGILGSSMEAPGLKGQADVAAADGVIQSRQDLEAELAGIDRKIVAANAKGQDIGDLKRKRATVAGIARIMEGGPTVLTQERGMLVSDYKSGWDRLDKGIAKANENPNLLLYKLQASAYKFSWMLIPISVPFVWLLFAWRREFKVYDHAVFVTYSLSFMTLLIVALTIAGSLGASGSFIVPVLVLALPIHLYRQLRVAYGISMRGALVRTFLLLIAGGLVLTLFTLLLIALGLMG